MKVANGKRSRISDIYYSFQPVNIIMKVLALNCIYKVNNQLTTKWPLFKVITCLTILCAFNSLILYLKISSLGHASIVTLKSAKFTVFVQFTFLITFSEYIVDLFYVKKYGRELGLKYYKAYENIDVILGFTMYQDVRKKITTVIIFFFTIFIGSCGLDWLAWVNNFPWLLPLIYTVEYVYPFIKMLTIMDCIAQVIQIEYRLRTIANLIPNSEITCPVFHNGFNWIDTAKKELIFEKKSHLQQLSQNVCNEIESLNKCYLMLLEQASYINQMYGLRMLLSGMTLLIESINLLNLAFRVLVQSLITFDYYPVASSVLRLLTSGAVLCSLVHRCEVCYRQCEKIINIVDTILVYKKTSNEHTKDALKELRQLVLTRPMYFHAAFFFRLDYTLLTAVTATIVTYTIIFLQSIH